MKICFKCNNEKPLSEYYKHKYMKDGHLNKCKACTKSDVAKHRGENIEKIREYDRKRGNRQNYDYIRNYREKYPNKYKAHRVVNNALKSGNLIKRPCEVCGMEENIHAHHCDYLYPLEVMWLCSAHHSQWHAINGEAKNP